MRGLFRSKGKFKGKKTFNMLPVLTSLPLLNFLKWKVNIFVKSEHVNLGTISAQLKNVHIICGALSTEVLLAIRSCAKN